MSGSFRQDNFFECPDCQFAQNGPLSSFADVGQLSEAIELLRSADYRIAEIDCSTEATLSAGIGEAFLWQKQFGYDLKELNLNAIADGVGASDAFPKSGRLLVVLRNFGELWEHSHIDAWHILDIFWRGSRDCLLFGNLMLTFLEFYGDHTEISDLGGSAVLSVGRNTLPPSDRSVQPR